MDHKPNRNHLSERSRKKIVEKTASQERKFVALIRMKRHTALFSTVELNISDSQKRRSHLFLQCNTKVLNRRPSIMQEPWGVYNSSTHTKEDKNWKRSRSRFLLAPSVKVMIEKKNPSKNRGKKGEGLESKPSVPERRNNVPRLS